MTTAFVPITRTAPFVGVCPIASGPDKSVAWMKFVPVTSVINALQFVPTASAKLVKLHVIVGDVLSRTITVNATRYGIGIAAGIRGRVSQRIGSNHADIHRAIGHQQNRSRTRIARKHAGVNKRHCPSSFVHGICPPAA